MRIAEIMTVVEGQGEVAAVPVLLRRMASEIVPNTWIEVPRPYRVGRDSLIRPGGIERVLDAVTASLSPTTGLVVLLDADDDCPARLGPRLLSRAGQTQPDRPVSVVLPSREFEAWFLAAAESLRGVRGLAADLVSVPAAQAPRDCKGWLTKHRTDGRVYKPVADQAALADRFDMRAAREHAPSFDKLWRDVERMLTGASNDE